MRPSAIGLVCTQAIVLGMAVTDKPQTQEAMSKQVTTVAQPGIDARGP